jgi:hypothetical protein
MSHPQTPEVRRCRICREPVIRDGLGELVHVKTGLYYAPNPNGGHGEHSAV